MLPSRGVLEPNRMSDFYIAELNVARLKHDINDPRIADFVNNLNRINAVAERSEGFVWRLKDDAGSSVSMPAANDPRLIPNLSVWDSVVSLESFVFDTVHKRFYKRRAEWFEVMDEMHFVMWPIEVSHRPSLEEAWQKLEHLNRNGASDQAFGWDYAKDAGLLQAEGSPETAA